MANYGAKPPSKGSARSYTDFYNAKPVGAQPAPGRRGPVGDTGHVSSGSGSSSSNYSSMPGTARRIRNTAGNGPGGYHNVNNDDDDRKDALRRRLKKFRKAGK